MAVRIGLLFFAALFLCIGTVFLGIALHQALLLSFQPWAAALLTALAGFVLAGLFALIGAHWSSRSSGAYGSGPLGAASASVSRAVESNPIVAIGAAALVGLVQSLIFGRRR